jgi:ribosomal protein S18 acetylase RimI-like enzyme
MATISSNNGVVKYYVLDAEDLDSDDCPRPMRMYAKQAGKGRTVGMIAMILVPEDQQGQGIGSDLLCRALTDLRDKGCERVVLQVDPTRQVDRLVRWYTEFGFHTIGTQKYNYPELGVVQDVYMGRLLRPGDFFERRSGVVLV